MTKKERILLNKAKTKILEQSIRNNISDGAAVVYILKKYIGDEKHGDS